MNGNKSTIFILVALLVFVGGFLFLSQRPKTVIAPTNQTPEKVETATSTGTSTATQSGIAEVKEVKIKAFSFGFEPKTVTVKKGEKVRFLVTNSGGVHNFVIEGLGVSKETPAGKETVVEFTPDKSGNFTFYCGIGNHKDLGMSGILVVE